MTRFRQLRRRLTPDWLQTDARRRWRDRLFRRFGIQQCTLPPILIRRPELAVESCLPLVVAHELMKNPALTCLQIGAFDGVRNDDLRPLIMAHRLRSVLVEPQVAAFTRLRETYRDQPQVTLLQAAIGEREGERELYYRRGTASQAASFNREHLRRHGIPDDEIVAERVACHTVAEVLRRGGLDHVDLIQIDAEGHDWPIIRSIDFSRVQPAILRFEHHHMTNRDADACLELLARHGYRFLPERQDIIAHRVVGAAAAGFPDGAPVDRAA